MNVEKKIILKLTQEIDEGDRVLFIDFWDIEFLQKISQKYLVSVLSKDVKMLESLSNIGIKTIFGSVNSNLMQIKTFQYDIVFLTNSKIQYTKDPIHTINELNRIAKKVYFSIDNVSNFFNRIKFLITGNILEQDDIKKSKVTMSFDNVKNIIKELGLPYTACFCIIDENYFNVKSYPFFSLFASGFAFYRDSEEITIEQQEVLTIAQP